MQNIYCIMDGKSKRNSILLFWGNKIKPCTGKGYSVKKTKKTKCGLNWKSASYVNQPVL